MKPLGDDLGLAIENQLIHSLDAKKRVRELVNTYKWNKNDANRLWDYGPDGLGPNVIVDGTK